MSEEEKLEILKDKFLKYHLEYKDEEMLFGIIDKLQKELDNSINKDIIRDKIKELDNETGIGFELDKDEINGARVVLKELLGE